MYRVIASYHNIMISTPKKNKTTPSPCPTAHPGQPKIPFDETMLREELLESVQEFQKDKDGNERFSLTIEPHSYNYLGRVRFICKSKTVIENSHPCHLSLSVSYARVNVSNARVKK